MKLSFEIASYFDDMKTEDLVLTLRITELKQLLTEVIDERLSRFAPTPASEQDSTGLISRLEVCKTFGITTTTLDKWRRYGVLPAEVKIASRVYFKKEQIEELIQERQRNKKPN